MLVLDFDAREEREREREREKWVDFQLLHIGFIGAFFLDDAVYLIQMFSSFSNFLWNLWFSNVGNSCFELLQCTQGWRRLGNKNKNKNKIAISLCKMKVPPCPWCCWRFLSHFLHIIPIPMVHFPPLLRPIASLSLNLFHFQFYIDILWTLLSQWLHMLSAVKEKRSNAPPSAAKIPKSCVKNLAAVRSPPIPVSSKGLICTLEMILDTALLKICIEKFAKHLHFQG